MEVLYKITSHFWFASENLETTTCFFLSDMNEAHIEDEGTYYVRGWMTYLLSYIVPFTFVASRSSFPLSFWWFADLPFFSCTSLPLVQSHDLWKCLVPVLAVDGTLLSYPVMRQDMDGFEFSVIGEGVSKTDA